MKKSTKGAIAASAAGVLLLGGAGSLAYWTATGDAPGSSVQAGELKLSAGTCDANWVYAGGTKSGGTVTAIVPGDVISKVCKFTILAKGDNLSATPTLPATVPITVTPNATGPATSFQATTAATYTTSPNGLAGGKVTSINDGNTLNATIKVTFPFGTAPANAINNNDTQLITATLDKLTVSLLQDNPNP